MINIINLESLGNFNEVDSVGEERLENHVTTVAMAAMATANRGVIISLYSNPDRSYQGSCFSSTITPKSDCDSCSDEEGAEVDSIAKIKTPEDVDFDSENDSEARSRKETAPSSAPGLSLIRQPKRIWNPEDFRASALPALNALSSSRQPTPLAETPPLSDIEYLGSEHTYKSPASSGRSTPRQSQIPEARVVFHRGENVVNTSAVRACTTPAIMGE